MKSTSIEAKAYGPDSTPEEIKLLQDRVYAYSDNILYWKEAPVVSKFQIEVQFEKLAQLSAGLDEFSLILDLAEAASPPDAKLRKQLSTEFMAYDSRVLKVAVFTEKNFLLNIAAKFVLSRAFGHGKVTVDKTLDAALQRFKSNG